MRTGRLFVLAGVVVLAACGEAASSTTSSSPTTTVAPSLIEPVTVVASTVVVEPPTTMAAPPTTAAAPTAGVTALEPGPLSTRTDAAQVWTGHELAVWGGVDDNGDLLTDGAAYDPATRTWRSLPAAEWMTTGVDAVWDGDGILVLGTEALWRVDVTDWSAESLTAPPYGSSFDVEWHVWTGRRLVVWLFDYAAFTSAVWQYDLETDAWAQVKGDPEAGVAVGQYVVGFEQADPSTTAAAPVKASIYDTVTGVITTSTGPVRLTQSGVLIAPGPDGVVYGWMEHHAGDDRDPNAKGFSFDPATGEWADIPGTELSLWECPAGTAAAGRFVYVYDCGGAGRWFDTTTLTYSLVGEPDALADVDGVWTGAELLLWGQPFCDACDTPPAVSFVSLTPPA